MEELIYVSVKYEYVRDPIAKVFTYLLASEICTIEDTIESRPR